MSERATRHNAGKETKHDKYTLEGFNLLVRTATLRLGDIDTVRPLCIAADLFYLGKTRQEVSWTPSALALISAVLNFGALKYERNNWRKGMPIASVIDSMGRHLEAMQAGVLLDDESGLPHLGHALCNAMFIIEYNKDKKLWRELV